MVKHLFILTIFVFCAIKSFAQYGIGIIDSINRSFCNKDTIKTIEYLELYSSRYPENIATCLVNLKLAEFYMHTKHNDIALNKLTIALQLNPNIGYPYYEKKEGDTCGLIYWQKTLTVKADICIKLSELFENMGNKQKALEYLDSAYDKYLPYKSCGTGMMLFRTSLSIKYAEFHLRNRDTLKAEKCLFEHCLSGTREVMEKLKEVLQSRYTRLQIQKEIKNGIAKLRKAKKQIYCEYDRSIEFSIFGHTKLLCFDSVARAKEYLEKYSYFRLLSN